MGLRTIIQALLRTKSKPETVACESPAVAPVDPSTESFKLRELYQKYRTAMAYLSIRRPNGDEGIGSAFHVGEGVFVTARHVVEGNAILEVGLTEPIFVPFSYKMQAEKAEKFERLSKETLGGIPMFAEELELYEVATGPFFHPDPRVDIAVFKVKYVHPAQAIVPLGVHLDERLIDWNWILSEAIIFGYPPVPLTTAPYLVVARAEINCLVETRHSPHPSFVLSAMPRGGFSGGLALSSDGSALGVIVESLVGSDSPVETGFLAVLSIEPIYECLAFHKILPEYQKKNWGSFWNSETIEYARPTDVPKIVNGFWHQSWQIEATMIVHDDGKKPYIEIFTDQARLNYVARPFDSNDDVSVARLPQADAPRSIRLIPANPDSLLKIAFAAGRALENTQLFPELKNSKRRWVESERDRVKEEELVYKHRPRWHSLVAGKRRPANPGVTPDGGHRR